jgi:SRSO17 transposase
VPHDREGEFVTEVRERDKRMTGGVEGAILEMYLSVPLEDLGAYRTKPQWAVRFVDRALEAGISFRAVVADSVYGQNTTF